MMVFVLKPYDDSRLTKTRRAHRLLSKRFFCHAAYIPSVI